MVLTVEENAKLFPKVIMPIYTPPHPVYRRYSMPCQLVASIFLISAILNFSHSDGCEMTCNFYFFLPKERHGRMRVWRHICNPMHGRDFLSDLS